MLSLLLISIGVVLTVATTSFCLQRGLTLPRVVAALSAAASVGAAYTIGTEFVLYKFPTDPRYFSTDFPRFLFQGAVGGTIIGVITCFFAPSTPPADR
jgi:hypothetical protein